jgi:hypothetical protein
MARDADAATQFVGSNSTNIPNGAMRWNPAAYQWETYSSSGGNWSAWSTKLNIGSLVLGQNAADGTMQAIPISQADNRYQAAGSYAAQGGNPSQAFLVKNSTAATQQAVPRAQADMLYSLSGGTGSVTFFVNAGLLSAEGQIGAATSGKSNAYLFNNANQWGLFCAEGGILLSYNRSDQTFSIGGGYPVSITAGTAAGHAVNVGQLSSYAKLNVAQTFTKTQASTQQPLGNISGTVTLDLTQGNDVSGNLTGNVTFANPSAMQVGTSGHIRLWQNNAGQYSAAFGSLWNFGQNGVPNWGSPNRRLTIVYYVSDEDTIQCSAWIGN